MSYNFQNHIKNNTLGPHAVSVMYSKSSKFIYLKSGRTAGTSIWKHAMRTVFDRHEVNNKSSSNFWNITDTDREKNYFTFTFVRNPYDRLVSNWNSFRYKKDAIYEHTTFEEFIKNTTGLSWLNKNGTLTNEHFLPLHYYTEFSRDNSFVDFVGKYENLQEDWNYVADKLKLDKHLIHMNSRRGPRVKNYKVYYTDELIEIVSTYYKRDLELFDYEF